MATLHYRFKTLDRKPRPPKPIRSQSYIGPTTVGPDSLGAGTSLKCGYSDVVQTSVWPSLGRVQ